MLVLVLVRVSGRFGRARMVLLVVVAVGDWRGKGVHRVATLIWRGLVSGGLRV